MRAKGRLENFRGFLREAWDEVASVEDVDLEKIRRFSEELKKQYAAAEAEWSQIDKSLTKWLTGPRGAGAILSAGMNWKIPALGFCIDGIGQLITAHTDRKNFRNNVPMAVFVDLNHKKQQ